jgi:hypothetical protein
LPPSAPITFLGYRPKFGDPPEEEIDNPAGWSMFTFTPSYHPKTKKYDGHTTPSGAHVVPPDKLGNRVMDGWEFHYKNWKAEEFDKIPMGGREPSSEISNLNRGGDALTPTC